MISNLFDLQGRVVVVIGGERDLGYDMAEALAEAGCDLAITSRTDSNAESAAAKLGGMCDGEVFPAQLDTSDHKELTNFAAKVEGDMGRVDVLINNAGGGLGLDPSNLFDRNPEPVDYAAAKAGVIGMRSGRPSFTARSAC